jgi:hypothetical protein
MFGASKVSQVCWVIIGAYLNLARIEPRDMQQRSGSDSKLELPMPTKNFAIALQAANKASACIARASLSSRRLER